MLLRLFALTGAPVELAQAEMAVCNEGAHTTRLGERQRLVIVRIAAFWVIGLFVVIQLVNLESTGKSDVAYWAHLGGMITGAILFPLLKRRGYQLFECIREPHYPGTPVVVPLAEQEGPR